MSTPRIDPRILRMDAFIYYMFIFMLHFILFRVTDLLDYTPEELTGKNIYNLCHGEDADKLRRSHLDRKNLTK